uniref:Uncharacterized protein n=1 Tax=Cyanistes caeruleus TaxID=156563 RepID=A0A8C0V5A2_CYACU
SPVQLLRRICLRAGTHCCLPKHPAPAPLKQLSLSWRFYITPGAHSAFPGKAFQGSQSLFWGTSGDVGDRGRDSQ